MGVNAAYDASKSREFPRLRQKEVSRVSSKHTRRRRRRRGVSRSWVPAVEHLPSAVAIVERSSDLLFNLISFGDPIRHSSPPPLFSSSCFCSWEVNPSSGRLL
ncbi:hypothetical protein DAI22_02g090000 [Oryza sativa Japonica Group]|nr:hypothetical protein DAI22_02g090000 [Oryza sativa Japonica Group]